MPCGWKAAHVDADLGDDDLSAEITDAWMGAQQAYGLTERVEIAVYCLVDLEDGRLERVDLAQMQSQQKAVLAGDPPLQCCADLLAWRPDASMHQGQQLVGVAFA